MADNVHPFPGGRRPRPLLRTLVGEVLRRHRQEQQRTLAEVNAALTAAAARTGLKVVVHPNQTVSE